MSRRATSICTSRVAAPPADVEEQVLPVDLHERGGAVPIGARDRVARAEQGHAEVAGTRRRRKHDPHRTDEPSPPPDPRAHRPTPRLPSPTTAPPPGIHVAMPALPRPPAPSGRAAPGAVLAVVCASTFFGSLNASAVNVLLPAIGPDLEVAPRHLGWIASLFLLVYGVAVPFYGRLAARLTARRLFVGGTALFGLGSLCCAAAPTFGGLLAARVVQGLGGAAFPGLGLALVSRSFGPRTRGTALGAVVTTLGFGAAAGPLLGGALADLASWRLLFAVSALALLVAPFAARLLPRDRAAAASLDWIGGGALVCSVAGTLYAVTEAGSVGITPLVVTSGAVALAGTVALAYRQATAADPFLPPALLRQGAYLRAVAAAFLATGSYLAVLVGVPLMLARDAGLTPGQIGIVLLPSALTTAVLGVVAGRAVDRVGPRLPAVSGALVLGFVAVALAALPAGAVGGVAIAAVGLSVGYALLNTSIAAAIGNMVGADLQPTALSLNAMVFFTGGSFGAALFVGTAARAGFSAAFALLLAPAVGMAVLAGMLPGAETHRNPSNPPDPSPRGTPQEDAATPRIDPRQTMNARSTTSLRSATPTRPHARAAILAAGLALAACGERAVCPEGTDPLGPRRLRAVHPGPSPFPSDAIPIGSGATWQWQLTGATDLSHEVDVYDLESVPDRTGRGRAAARGRVGCCCATSAPDPTSRGGPTPTGSPTTRSAGPSTAGPTSAGSIPPTPPSATGCARASIAPRRWGATASSPTTSPPTTTAPASASTRPNSSTTTASSPTKPTPAASASR